MIPKIIHYCWFGRKEKPNNIIDNIRNWQHVLPDYQIKEWNEDNFDVNSMVFTKEAYKVKKYAFVSDIARLHALMTEGGIYLDTDVRVLKSFDPYLNHNSFIGLEDPKRLSTAVIGAHANVNWIRSFLSTYKEKHFITRRGMLQTTANTDLLTYFFNNNGLFEKQQEVEIYDIDYFSAKLYPSMEYMITDNTVSVHEYSGSWLALPTTSFPRLHNIFIRYFHPFKV